MPLTASDADVAALRSFIAAGSPGDPRPNGPHQGDATIPAALRRFWSTMPYYYFFDFYLSEPHDAVAIDRIRTRVAELGDGLLDALPAKLRLVAPGPASHGQRFALAVTDETAGLDDPPLVVFFRRDDYDPDAPDAAVGHFPSLLQYLTHSALWWASWGAQPKLVSFFLSMPSLEHAPLAFPTLSAEARQLGSDLLVFPQNELNFTHPRREAQRHNAWMAVLSHSLGPIVEWCMANDGWRVPGTWAPTLAVHHRIEGDIDDPRFRSLRRYSYPLIPDRLMTLRGDVIHRIGFVDGRPVWLTYCTANERREITVGFAWPDNDVISAWLR